MVHDVPHLVAHHLLAAIADSKTHFAFKESNHDMRLHNTTAAEVIVVKSFFDTQSSYTLHSNAAYMSLDEAVHSAAVVSLSDTHVRHCAHASSPALRPGDFLVASQAAQAERTARAVVFKRVL